MTQTASRRHFLQHATGLCGALAAQATGADVLQPGFASAPRLAPIQARADRIVALSVCTRPFRAQGPRIETERFGRQTVIHNYGHGGSGWSLSWGSAQWAVRLALATGARRIGVIGCGAIGLTSALEAQRAGLRVRIYAKDRPPDVRSAGATGVWSPDSRVCSVEHATPAFERRWEAMARHSFRRYQHLLGLPGDPVEWRSGYVLSDEPFGGPRQHGDEADGEPDYAQMESRLLADIRPRSQPLTPEQHPFPVPFVRHYTQLTFNLSAYARLLMDDFLRQGGEIETVAFDSPRQFARLEEDTLVNATGYGARELFGDTSIIPVRGQTARLVPQPEVDYGLTYLGHNLSVVPRRDGILVQAQAPGDFGNADATPDRAASDAAVARLAALFSGAAPAPRAPAG